MKRKVSWELSEDDVREALVRYVDEVYDVKADRDDFKFNIVDSVNYLGELNGDLTPAYIKSVRLDTE